MGPWCSQPQGIHAHTNPLREGVLSGIEMGWDLWPSLGNPQKIQKNCCKLSANCCRSATLAVEPSNHQAALRAALNFKIAHVYPAQLSCLHSLECSTMCHHFVILKLHKTAWMCVDLLCLQCRCWLCFSWPEQMWGTLYARLLCTSGRPSSPTRPAQQAKF